MKYFLKLKYFLQSTVFIFVALLLSSFFLSATAQTANQAMAYDQLGRLTQITYPGGVTIAFAYDAAGNRTSYTVTGSPNIVPPAPTPVGQLKIAPAANQADQKSD